jgi:large subunit ribosomal protein L21
LFRIGKKGGFGRLSCLCGLNHPWRIYAGNSVHPQQVKLVPRLLTQLGRAWYIAALRQHFLLGGFVYAIIRSGGKQYRVAAGDRLQVERDVLGSADKDQVTFSEVLMIGGDQPQVGMPTVQGASVVATIVRETRGDKIIVFKKKRRKNHTKRTHGHRQDVVDVRIDSINL